jgi:hypothetical protein
VLRAADDTTLEFAADAKRLGAKICISAVLRISGPALTHHPHVQVIAQGGGLSPDGASGPTSRRSGDARQFRQKAGNWCRGRACWHARTKQGADREVILSAGGYGSPHLLLLSGIGPAADLASLQFPTITAMSG